MTPHNLKEAKMVKLLLMRGGDRRFESSAGFIFAAYTYRMRKAGGGVALAVSNFCDASSSVPNDENLGRDPGVRRGDAVSELQNCLTVKDVVETLEKDSGENLQKLMKRLVPFAKTMPGTPIHIARERNHLYAMMASTNVTDEGCMSVFGTHAPCDRFNPEFYDIVTPPSMKGRPLTATERATLLRSHPGLAARVFDARVTAMFENIYCGSNIEYDGKPGTSEAMPFGKVTDYWIRIEFQGETKTCVNSDSVVRLK